MPSHGFAVTLSVATATVALLVMVGLVPAGAAEFGVFVGHPNHRDRRFRRDPLHRAQHIAVEHQVAKAQYPCPGEALEMIGERGGLGHPGSRSDRLAAAYTKAIPIASAAGFTEQSFRYREDLAYCAFRTATDASKVDLAFQVLGSASSQWQRREAIRYLITTDPQGTVTRLTGGIGRFLPLHQLLPMSDDVQLLFSEARRLGYALEQTDEGYVLVSFEDGG